jgi:hypothetical protein
MLNGGDHRKGGEMKTIELTDTEATILAETLESAISELKTEISHTDRRELHAELKDREAVIAGILKQL